MVAPLIIIAAAVGITLIAGAIAWEIHELDPEQVVKIAETGGGIAGIVLLVLAVSVIK